MTIAALLAMVIKIAAHSKRGMRVRGNLPYTYNYFSPDGMLSQAASAYSSGWCDAVSFYSHSRQGRSSCLGLFGVGDFKQCKR
jgi:hypothetical protein